MCPRLRGFRPSEVLFTAGRACWAGLYFRRDTSTLTLAVGRFAKLLLQQLALSLPSLRLSRHCHSILLPHLQLLRAELSGLVHQRGKALRGVSSQGEVTSAASWGGGGELGTHGRRLRECSAAGPPCEAPRWLLLLLLAGCHGCSFHCAQSRPWDGGDGNPLKPLRLSRGAVTLPRRAPFDRGCPGR